MKNVDWKEIGLDVLVDIVAGMLIAVGVYNFALNANFPVAGFSGIAIIMYHLLGLPVGIGTIILNIPVSIFCYKFLGRTFFLKSVKSMVISSVLMDYVAPLLPVYDGSRFLAALCMGVLCGIGYAMIFMRGSSTGGPGLYQRIDQKGKAAYYPGHHYICTGYGDHRSWYGAGIRRCGRPDLWYYRYLPDGDRNGPDHVRY